jgi:signal transduction histidine kinase
MNDFLTTSSQSEAPQPATHVLLIEDNPGDADLARLRLVEANSDMTVACATSLSDGLLSAAQRPPSVILVDLDLPDSRGAETFRKLLDKAPGIPVVVLTGQQDEGLAIKAMHHGVQDYLVKGDLDSRQLDRAIRYAVERQALLTSLAMSQKQQLQFKDEFLSHVSHELRTPLTCIHQFVTLMLDGLSGTISADQRDHLDTVLRSVNQLRSMIGDLLEATRVESHKLRMNPRCFAIEESIQHAISLMRNSAAERRIGIECAVDNRIPLVQADPDRVLQVLVNLIDNAIKFTPPDGSIIVKACLSASDADMVHISITDTGQGISSDARALVFERLYQNPNANDNSRKGLGLGLYIARELVQLNGGKMWVESQIGHGSTFSFTLPLFSLGKILAPLIALQPEPLAPAFTVVKVEVAFIPGSNEQLKLNIQTKCNETLQRCILPGKDVLLPALGASASGEKFVIVASLDKTNIGVLTARIRQQLEANPQISASGLVKISTFPVRPAAGVTSISTEVLIEQVAACMKESAVG